VNLSPEMRLVLATIATWRLTHLLVEEDGPWDLVVRLRRLLGDSVAGRAMDCFYCMSIWLAAPVAFALTRGAQVSIVDRALVWLALSGGACLLERATARASASTAELDPPPERAREE